MSEEIQGNHNRQQHHQTIEASFEKKEEQTTQRDLAPERSSLAPTPRAGALLVESYGRTVQKKANSLSPHRVLFEYSKFLVTSLLNSGSGTTSLERDARALLDSVELAHKELSTQDWNQDFIFSVIQVLESNPTLKDSSVRINALVTSLRSQIKIERVSVMDSKLSDDAMASLISGFADRISLAGSNGISNILAELGPSCTRSPAALREVLADLSRTHGGLTESSLASLIFFFSDKRNTNDSGSTGLSSALMGSIVTGRNMDNSSLGWNLETVAQVVSEDYSSFDWDAVAQNWDFPDFRIVDANQFRTLIELFRAGAKSTPPLSALTRQWRNSAAQFSLLEALVACPPSIFMVPLDEEEIADAAVALATGPTAAPNPQCWASMDILQRLLHLSDVPSLYRPVRDLFVRCLMSCPEVLFCSLVRLQLHVANTAASQPGGEALASAGRQLKTELMRELIPLFFRPNAHRRVQNGPAALRRLYSISPTTVMAACFEAWRSVAQDSPQVRLAGVFHIINIARLLPSPADAVASLLSGNKDAEYSISIAFVMSDNDFLQLKPWLGEKLTLKGSVAPFAVSLVSYLRKTYTTAKPRGGGVDGPLVSLENISISLQLLDSLDASILSQSVAGSLDRVLSAGTLGENVKSLFEACLTTHPSLRATLLGQNSASSGAPATSADDVEEMATAYFQKIYTSEQSITEVVEMLKRFKTSGNSKENEIFACMVHNLFNEYRFFAKYPEKELRITGILFGTLIQEQLVSSITLGIALRYVLEALRKPPETTSTGKMFKFGMFALEQFKGRLHEWPQYCSHIVQIPHLKEKYAELVAEIELEMSKSQNRVGGSGNSVTSQSSSGGMQARDLVSASSATSVASAASSTQQLTIPATNENPRVAVFGEKLGRAVTDSCDEERVFEAPGDEILDKVQFLVNNLAPANVEKKAQELKEMLDPEYFNWLGHFLVVKRISTQANFHSLYLLFLDSLGDYGKGLVEAILSSVYHNIGKLLRSPKITTSSSERSYLKNLGIWLGQITLARNRPILQVMLDCKELLLQGYETGKLIAVAPFLAKTLEGAKSSKVFRPPNPWLMGILGVFRSVYNVQGLKMNIKFEVEVLCKNLGIRLEDIPLRNEVLALRIAPAKVNNPDFNVKTTATAQKSTGLGNTAKGVPGSSAGLVSPLADGSANSSGTGQEQLETVIPNLASYVTVNSTLVQLIQTQGGATLASLVTPSSFKRWVPIAVDRAIREIIQPVVERSVTIACITTKEIVTKDFAMESDETKLRKAGQLMVANLAGSLALVTCREPLRSSISSHLRQLLTTGLGTNSKLGEQEQNAIEQCVQICSADNLELGCRLIEKAATEKAVRDVDEALAPAINARRTHREQTGQPYFDTSIFASGSQRYPTALPEALRPKQGGLKAEHYQLYESFQRVTRSGGAAGTAGAGSTLPSRVENQGVAKDIQTPQKPSGQQFSAEVLASISTKLDSVVNALLSSAGARSGEVKLAMLPPDHQIRQLLGAIKHVMPNSTAGNTTRPLSSPEQEMVLAFSQGIFKRLYDLSLKEPLRLEVLVALLENINNFCPKLGKDMGTWVTYAPTNNDAQRRLHKTVLLLLLRSRLLSVHELDNFLAARADQGRNHIWVEFSLYLIRTAFVELISTPSDFPKLIDLMTRIVDNRSQANQQVVQAYRKQILRMLEETRSLPDGRDRAPRPPGHAPAPTGSRVSVGESTSLSKESLERLSIAPKLIAEATSGFVSRDPTNARQHVTVLLDGWMRIQADGIRSETSTSQYLQVLEQYGFGKNEEQTERFLRLSITIIVEAVLKSASVEAEKSRAPLNFAFIDMYSRLLHLLFRRVNVSGSQDHVDAQRLGMLNRILGVLVRTMIWHSEKWKVDGKIGPWDQRPWYRLFMNLVVDVNKPNPEFDSIRLGVLSVFGSAFHACQPLVMPGFAFSWLELISHRHFLPNLMLFPGQKAWHIMHQLLIDAFLFLEPYLKTIELAACIKKLYEGSLRVLLVLLHDFPSFLAGYHVSICNVIPDTCVQLRNIVLSATPKGMSPPDPFTPNLKIDLLRDITRSPVVLSNVVGPIESFRSHLDAYLKDGQRRNLLSALPQLLLKAGTGKVDAAKANSLILYVGAHALARMQSSQISLSRTPEIELIQKLMEFDDHGRYVCLNAIASQLRYPSSHTHYFSCVMLYLFSESKNVAVKEQVTRVLLERLIVNRPHPWGLLVTFIELIKNQRYSFWSYSFTRCATEIEKVFESVARSCMPPGAQRSTLVGGDDQ